VADRSSADFSLSSLSQLVNTSREVIDKAKGTLESLYRREQLPPLPGWEGSILEGYMDILGLNGRPIRVNHGHSNGLRR
jgi:hypothetical protein